MDSGKRKSGEESCMRGRLSKKEKERKKARKGEENYKKGRKKQDRQKVGCRRKV